MPDDASTQHDGAGRVAPRQQATVVAAFLLMMTGGVMLCGAAPTAARPASRPTTQRVFNHPAAAVVRRFHDHLKAERQDDARKLLATSAKPVRDAERRVKRLAASLSAGGYDFSVLDAKDGGDAAVVLINDFLKDGRRTIDIKPWYLVRQGGEWRLLAKFTDYELKEYGLGDATLAEFKKLEEWAERREPQLRKEQPDCGC
jgi:hypothetical protein